MWLRQRKTSRARVQSSNSRRTGPRASAASGSFSYPWVRIPERVSMSPRQGRSMAPIRRQPRRCVTSSMKSSRTRSKGWDCAVLTEPKHEGNCGPSWCARLPRRAGVGSDAEAQVIGSRHGQCHAQTWGSG